MEEKTYEQKHINYLIENASECCLFLKKNNEFPIDAPTSVNLVGNGARHTIKGGTGSGDVATRFYKSIEQSLISYGFTITSNTWLDEYDSFKASTKKGYIKDAKKKARKVGILSAVYSMGYFEEEKNYNISCDYDADICIYVLSRNSGEGNDRRNIKGDVQLSDKEIEDIKHLNDKFKKFMLVLNVGGPVDLSPIMDVSNILLLSQLGVVTGDVFARILLGQDNPSGKLATTWAKPENYPFFSEFGDRDDTYYKEGVYVGYRYFRTLDKPVLFPFGYGLSYTDFDIDISNLNLNDMELTIESKVKNIGKYSGKEVVQVYVTKPNTYLDNPYIELVNFKKTNVINPNEEENVSLVVDFTKLSNYDEKRAVTFLQKGNYIIWLGNSCENIKPIANCVLNEEVILEELNNKCTCHDFEDFLYRKEVVIREEIPTFTLDSTNIQTRVVEYKKDTYTDDFVSKLSDEELAYICLGLFGQGFAAIVGSSCKHVVGGAGETTLAVNGIDKSLTMADGPAGLRIKTEYGQDEKGIYDITIDPMMEKMLDFLPKISGIFIKPPKGRKGTIHHQYTTAIPIGTALAQSYNYDFAYNCGKLVAEEMKIFGVDLWLAPALNIHRNILCGRNFEYYSEDPVVSGKIACAIINGVEEDKSLGVTIKHVACNNQEFNRNNNNSHVSERALREIYLKGFEICIKEANPKALMTSYNLINGKHTSESFELINDILRCEWGYDGLVMTDWIASGRSFCSKSVYPAPYASNSVLAGCDLTMSGCPADFKDIKRAYKKGKLKREDLIHSASRVYRSILKQKV